MTASSNLTKPPRLREALLKETRVIRDFFEFLRDRKKLSDVPRGRGEPILVIPGYLASDVSTWILRRFLNRLGYRASGWELGRNRGNVDELLRVLSRKVEKLFQQHSQRIRLVGWSLGGFLAREIARDHPDWVHSVVSMGSPLVGGAKYTVVAKRFRMQGREDELDRLEKAIADRAQKPIRVPLLSLYSKNDGIVAWQASVDRDERHNVENVEVESTHLGFGFHVATFRKLARFLAR